MSKSNLVELPYTRYKAEIIRFVKKHHYTRRCTSVWSHAYGILNEHGRIQAVAVYGPAPYPNVARAFVRDQAHTDKHIWQSRMVGAGISADELNALIEFANTNLLAKGYWWVHTLTDPVSKVIDTPMNLFCKGYTGEVYHRTGALYLGTSGSKRLTEFLVDGKPIHVRQGAITLTLSNIHTHYPNSHIRPIYGNHKQRWAYVLANTPRERAERILLMAYHAQPYQPMRQPLLLSELLRLIIQVMTRKEFSHATQ
jgi:hypothetical protein